MSEHEGRLDELFDRVIALRPDERDAFIEAECEGNTDLERALRDLLANDAGTGDRFLDGGESPSPAAPAHEIPEWIGRYRIVREIGRGGMGVVYEAQQENPDRRVALKVVRSSFMSEALISRFRREAQVLGQLQHRGIAHIYESGSATIGRDEVPFFAMEHIDGLPINVHVRKNELTMRSRLELVARVCDAVQHAHQKGIIHRDLKPSNVLVAQDESGTGTRRSDESATTIDEIGQPKILDFGIARFTDADVQATVQTSTGQIIGTLAYMAPEQVEGRPEKLDTRCDVYALGVMLYTLLADRPPHELHDVPIAEAARVIRDDEPEALSTINASLRGDVTTIARKAMEKDPERRYASAGLLADDIRRFLRDEPISARPASTLYQLRKFARRNRALVGGTIAAIVLLTAGVIGTSIGLSRALDANRSLEQRNEDLAAVAAYQASQLESIDLQGMGVTLRRYLLDSAPDDRRDALAQELAGINLTTGSLRMLDEHVFAKAERAINTEFETRPTIRARLLHALGQALREVGLYDSAVRVTTDALNLRRAELGASHADTLETMALLGQVHLDAEDTTSAERVYAERLKHLEELHGAGSLRALAARHNLAAVLITRHEYAHAEETLRPVLAAMTEAAGPDDEEPYGVMNSLAIAVGNQGRNEEAIELLERAIEGRTRLLGQDHPKTLFLRTNLAARLEGAGRLGDAEVILREVLAIGRRSQGDDHGATLSTMDNLAQLLLARSQFEEAETLASECLERRRRMLGPEHPVTMRSLNSLAAILDTMGRFEEAEPMYREVYENFRTSLGPGHSMTISAMGNLGYVINVQGRHEEAEPYYRGSYEHFEATYGPDDPRTLRAMGNYAVLLTGQEKFEEAEPLHRRSYETRRRILGEHNPSTLVAMYNLGDFYLNTGDAAAAEPYCLGALEGHRALDENHIGVLHSLGLVARMHAAMGRTDQAEVFYRQAIDRRADVLGEDHPLTEHAREDLQALLAPAEPETGED